MRSYSKKTIEERFWEKVDKGPNCWVWTGATQTKGYGVMNCGKMMKAHRVSWIINIGPIPEGLDVLHKCDNPPCIRPNHLFLGTDLENMRDCFAKGRSPVAKLSPDDLDDVRYLFNEMGYLHREIAEYLGVSRSAISKQLRIQP